MGSLRESVTTLVPARPRRVQRASGARLPWRLTVKPHRGRAREVERDLQPALLRPQRAADDDLRQQRDRRQTWARPGSAWRPGARARGWAPGAPVSRSAWASARLRVRTMAVTARLAFSRPPVTDRPPQRRLGVDRAQQRLAQRGRRGRGVGTELERDRSGHVRCRHRGAAHQCVGVGRALAGRDDVHAGREQIDRGRSEVGEARRARRGCRSRRRRRRWAPAARRGRRRRRCRRRAASLPAATT